MDISAIIIAKNEKKNIKDCLDSLAWCSEILVIDDNSTDSTAKISRQHKAKIIFHPLNEDFSAQRNFALQHAKNEWVFFVDADERVSTKLRDEILHVVQHVSPDTNGFYLKRQDYMWGKAIRFGEQGNTYLLRLARKDAGKWSGKVHEIWDIAGKTDYLDSVLLHYPHQSIAAFLKEINIYTTMRAHELYERKISAHWWDVLLYPKAKFLQNYIWKWGFLDGIEGFILAILMSMHSFLVRGKLWQLTKK